MKTHYSSWLFFMLITVTSNVFQGTVSMVMSVRRDMTTPRDAVALVMRARNESRLRLLLQKPDDLFDLLASPSTGNQNRDVVQAEESLHLWVAVDGDYDSGLFYLLDRAAQCVTVVDQETNQFYCIYSGISRKAQALAVNWVEDAVYWTDAAYDAIFEYKATGRCRDDGCVRTVVSTDLDTPTGLAVHPHRDFLFWTDVRGLGGKLHRSNLGGGARIVLFEQLSQPSAVAIDYRAERVYWLAQTGENSVVETSDLNGGDRYSSVVLTNSRLFDLDVFNGLLLMTEPQKGELVIHDVTSNVTRRLWAAGPYGVCVYSADVQNSVLQNQRTMLHEEKDRLQEGFLVLVSEQGSLSVLDKMAVTATREVTARQIGFLDGVTAIAADVTKKFLYFYDRTDGAIERLNLQFLSSANSTSRYEVKVISKVPGIVAGMAVDWLSGTIYWTDRHFNRVAAMTEDGSHVRCMACRDVDQPRDIVVHPIRNFLFWADVAGENPRIERLNIRTLDRQEIPLKMNNRPLALTIDFKDDTLYWSEGPALCRADLEGRGSEPCSVPSGLIPLAVKSLDILHDFLVWTDFREGINVSDKEDNFDALLANSRVLVHDEFYSDLLYFHPSRQPSHLNYFQMAVNLSIVEEAVINASTLDISGNVEVSTEPTALATSTPLNKSHPCALNNGGCDHFCIPISGGVSHCACATGYWKRRNGSCASGFVEEDFVLVVDPVLNGIYQQFLYLTDFYVIPLKHVQRPSDVIFDRNTRKLYWSDVGLQAISRAYLNGSQQEIIFAHSEIVADKLAFDEKEHLLLFLDTTEQKVGVISLETMTYKIIVHSFLHVFHQISVDEANSKVYLSASPSEESLSSSYLHGDELSNDAGSILRCDVNGDNMTEVMTTDGEPRGLVVSGDALYWTNAGSRTLNILNISTGVTSRLVQLPDWSKPDDITLLGGYIYWTDIEKSTLFRVNIEEKEVEESGQSVLYQLSGITSTTHSTTNFSLQGGSSRRHGSRDPCRHNAVSQSQCLSVYDAVETVRRRKGFCRVPTVANGHVLTINPGAYVTSDDVMRVKCKPGFGERGTRNISFTAVCQGGIWIHNPSCDWMMTYNISGNRYQGYYVVMVSSTNFVIPEGVTHIDALAIGGGGGGMHACSARFNDVTRAGNGGMSRVGRYLRAGGGRGGTLHSGGRGGFGTVFFGGPGEISSRCLGGGAAGQTTWSRDCRLGSTSCPFCGAGGAPTGCSLCHSRDGGCRGPWALPGQGISADSFGGGATGWSGGGGGGGGGYSRRIIDVTPGEMIPVAVGRGGRLSVGRAGGGVVVLGWGGRLEDVLPRPDPLPVTCRHFNWTSDVNADYDYDMESCRHGGGDRDP